MLAGKNMDPVLGKVKKVKDPVKDQDLVKQLEDFKLQLDSMAQIFRLLRKTAAKSKSSPAEAAEAEPLFNHDGLPLNSSYIGLTSKSQYPYILMVDEDGAYRVGNEKFASLSAAAEHVSGVRRSGWTFWSLFDGRTLKEVYKDK